jgi:hypothetical protein
MSECHLATYDTMPECHLAVVAPYVQECSHAEIHSALVSCFEVYRRRVLCLIDRNSVNSRSLLIKQRNLNGSNSHGPFPTSVSVPIRVINWISIRCLLLPETELLYGQGAT